MASIRDLHRSAEGNLKRYCALDGEYAWPQYDIDPAPDRLSGVDLTAPALLSYPFPTKVLQHLAGGAKAEFVALRSAIEAVLEDSDAATLHFESLESSQISEGAPGWDVVRASLLAAWPCKGLTTVAVTKILHRKRPNLVPIIDSRVHRFYGTQRAGYEALFRAIHADLAANKEFLDDLRGQYVLPDGRTMSRLRALDIVIWMARE